MRRLHGVRIAKISLDAGGDCPNRDGSIGVGGCVWCPANGSSSAVGGPGVSLREQFGAGCARLHGKWNQAQYIAYLQSFSNTHTPLERLREICEEVLTFPGVMGVSISTRPDCLPTDIVAYLAELHSRAWLLVELGLQTIHDDTNRRCNRGHGYKEFLEGLGALSVHGVPVCVHLINGLPGEDRAMMLETARVVGEASVQGIKFHLLHVLRDTTLADMWRRGEVRTLERDEYVDIVCSQLELLPPSVAIHRLTGDGAWSELLAPRWSTDKWGVLNAINAELVRRDTWQGRLVVE